MRGADEHLYEVGVEGIVELALEAPFELRVVEVAGMEFEVVGVDGDVSSLNWMMPSTASPLGRAKKVSNGCS